MHINSPIDPRITSIEHPRTTFVVRDWYDPDGGQDPTSEITHEISDASIWEVLSWAGTSRIENAIATYVWVVCPSYAAEERAHTLIGVLDWQQDVTLPPRQHATLPEPDSEAGWNYFTRKDGNTV